MFFSPLQFLGLAIPGYNPVSDPVENLNKFVLDNPTAFAQVKNYNFLPHNNNNNNNNKYNIIYFNLFFKKRFS